MDGTTVIGEGAERRDQADRLRQAHVLRPDFRIPDCDAYAAQCLDEVPV